MRTVAEHEKNRSFEFSHIRTKRLGVLWWMVSTILILAIQMILSNPLTIISGNYRYLVLSAFSAIVGAIAGVVGGVLQKWILRSNATEIDGWVWATALGWAVNGVIINTVPLVLYSVHEELLVNDRIIQEGPLADLIISAIIGFALGAGIGLAQWFVLRKRIRGSQLWPIMNAMAYSLAFAVDLVLRVYSFLELDLIYSPVFVGSVAGTLTYIFLSNKFNGTRVNRSTE